MLTRCVFTGPSISHALRLGVLSSVFLLAEDASEFFLLMSVTKRRKLGEYDSPVIQIREELPWEMSSTPQSPSFCPKGRI